MPKRKTDILTILHNENNRWKAVYYEMKRTGVEPPAVACEEHCSCTICNGPFSVEVSRIQGADAPCPDGRKLQELLTYKDWEG